MQLIDETYNELKKFDTKLARNMMNELRSLKYDESGIQ